MSAATDPQSVKSDLWLRGLLTVAWADGHYTDEEKTLVADLLGASEVGDFRPVTPQELAQALPPYDPRTGDFLRTAVMVALADGLYSDAEDRLLRQFCQALGQPLDVLENLRATLVKREGNQYLPQQASERHDLLDPVRRWLDQLEIHDPRVARFLCRLIPAQCPFERDVVLFGRKVVHIPPLCQLNPLYEQLVGLRLRALAFLAERGEDVPA